MTQMPTDRPPADQTAMERLVSLLTDELKEARKREEHLLRLLEQEQRSNAAWKKLFDRWLKGRKASQEVGEVLKEFGIRENRAELIECLHEHYPLPLSPAQIQRFLGLQTNPVYTLARMAKEGIISRPSRGLYALTDEYVELMRQTE